MDFSPARCKVQACLHYKEPTVFYKWDKIYLDPSGDHWLAKPSPLKSSIAPLGCKDEEQQCRNCQRFTRTHYLGVYGKSDLPPCPAYPYFSQSDLISLYLFIYLKP